jgi:hypothetical protein
MSAGFLVLWDTIDTADELGLMFLVLFLASGAILGAAWLHR